MLLSSRAPLLTDWLGGEQELAGNLGDLVDLLKPGHHKPVGGEAVVARQPCTVLVDGEKWAGSLYLTRNRKSNIMCVA